MPNSSLSSVVVVIFISFFLSYWRRDENRHRRWPLVFTIVSLSVSLSLCLSFIFCLSLCVFHSRDLPRTWYASPAALWKDRTFSQNPRPRPRHDIHISRYSTLNMFKLRQCQSGTTRERKTEKKTARVKVGDHFREKKRERPTKIKRKNKTKQHDKEWNDNLVILWWSTLNGYLL